MNSQVCVVTGGASGIGLALAVRAARYGMFVVVADVDKDGMNKASELCLKEGAADVYSIPCDLSKADGIKQLHMEVYRKCDKVHYVFLNAGSIGPQGNLVTQIANEELQRFLTLNQSSVFEGLRLFSKSMHEGGEVGHIVSTASIYGCSPSPGIYGVTKQAVVAYTEAFQMALIGLESKVSCSVLCPSFINTNLVQSSAVENIEGIAGLDMAKTLIRHGASAEQVAELAFEGMFQGKTYIHTEKNISEAFARDKFNSVIESERLSFVNHDRAIADLFSKI